jgi:hypothetical protein
MNIRDITDLLDRIPIWKKLKALPDQLEQLQARVAALEARLSDATGDVCPKCRQPRFDLVDSGPDKTFGDLGVQSRTYRCSSCGFEEKKQIG